MAKVALKTAFAPKTPQKRLLLGCNSHYLREGSKPASKQVFLSPGLGNKG
jgi:hypothetical protein